jgi:hypothetical protein
MVVQQSRQADSRVERKGRLRGPDGLCVLQRLKCTIERAVELGLSSEGLRQFRLHGGALAVGKVTAA